MNVHRLLPALLVIALGYAAPPKHELQVIVDGKPIVFKTARPQVLRGRTLVPLRGIFEAIGAYVEYDEANHIIHAKKANEEVELRLGERIAKKNGAEIMMDQPALIYAGTAMVPLRFVAESLGAEVSFSGNRIEITTNR